MRKVLKKLLTSGNAALLSVMLLTVFISQSNKQVDIPRERVAPYVQALYTLSMNPFDKVPLQRFCSSFHVEHMNHSFHVTNKHCCEANYVKHLGMYNENGDVLEALFIGEVDDLCILNITKDKKSLPLASVDVVVMDKIYVLGFPNRYDLTITEGRISKKELEVFGQIMSVTTAKVAGGSSGGVVVNHKGEVVGVLTIGDAFMNGGFVQLPNLIRFLKTSLLMHYSSDVPTAIDE